MRIRTRLVASLCGFSLSSLLGAQGLTSGKAQPPLGPIPAGTSQRPASFGTQESVTSVFAGSFNGLNSSDPVHTTGGGYRYLSGGSLTLMGSVQIPSGVMIDFIGANACDSNGGAFTVVLYDSGVLSDYQVVGSFSTVSSGCEVEYNGAALNYLFAENAGRNLEIFVYQTLAAPQDGSAGVEAVEVWWHRLVSPAPALSDFGDVPTSSPQFQFIEALFRSGITVGCGGGNYCPNSPVTRGQMAVYLAKALGLQWSY